MDAEIRVSIECDDSAGRYVECGSDGIANLVIDCPLGCSDTAEKCVDIDPSNGLADFLAAAETGPDVVFTGSATINTSTGAVYDGVQSVSIPNASHNGIRVFSLRAMSVEGTLKVTGTAPLALVVDGDVTITGTIDVSADGGTGGPGQVPSTAPCAGVGTNANIGPVAGCGGGGRSGVGAAGGADGNGNAGRPGGATFPDEDISPLQGGCPGGTSIFSGTTASGGGGGGAMQIVSRTEISLLSAGIVDASGGGGRAGNINGTGGGSGGAVLLEAPVIVLDGQGVVIATKGGGGSAAGGSGHGGDGSSSGGVAAAGTNGSYATGGYGGNETLAPAPGAAGSGSGASGGGGGGRLGVARFNTTAGTVAPQNGALLRTVVSNGTIATRLIP